MNPETRKAQRDGDRLRWPSGVAGSQCQDCGETTVVRAFGTWEDGDRMLCRECVEPPPDQWFDFAEDLEVS